MNKVLKISLWVISVFFLLLSLASLSQLEPVGILFLLPAVFLNPKANEILDSRYKFQTKIWMKVCSVVIPLLVIGLLSPYNDIKPVSNLSNNQSEVSVISEREDISSDISSADESAIESNTDETVTEDDEDTVSSTAEEPPKSNDSSVGNLSENKSVSSTPKNSEGTTPSKNTNKTDETSTLLFVTESGKKYHRDGCSYLKKSKIQISLERAKAEYEPCSRCKPPQ